MQQEKPTWGGARTGSGRRKMSDDKKRRKTGFVFSPAALEVIERRAREEDITRSEAVNRCILDWMAFSMNTQSVSNE